MKLFVLFNVNMFVSLLLFLSGCGNIESDMTTSDSESEWKHSLNNYENWGIYRGDQKANQYSELDQINAENVHQLEKAWEYEYEGEPQGPGIYSNPIIIDGLLYFNTPHMKTVALDAATGEEVWVFDPAKYNDGEVVRSRSRGVVYWEDNEGNNQRILSSVRDRVYAIDAKTGKLIEPFGQEEDSKFIDLRKDLTVPPELANIEITVQGSVYKDYLILSGRQPEGNQSTPGHIRAYNTLTGEFEWIFHTIPQKGQFGYDTWEFEENMHYGGANPWGGFTIDEERGWVFAATGSAAGEFIYGGHRKGRNLFSSTVLALDAETGEREWHYQVIRHDIFDYDLPPAPILATINKDGETRDVVVQLTKMGLIFVLDRDTGEPVFPVVDIPVPDSDVPGEEAWPTQPYPVLPPPLVRQQLYRSDLTDITPESRDSALKEFRKYETGPLYDPASIGGTIVMPGELGGLQWHGGSFDPETNVLYTNANEIPSIYRLEPLEPDNLVGDRTPVQRGANIYNTNCTACHGLNKQGNPPSYPPLTDLNKTPEELRANIVEGVGGMPAFSQFSEEELDDLIVYLESDIEEDGEDEEMRSVEDYRTSDGNPPTWSGGSGAWEWSTTTPQYAQITPWFQDHMGYPAIKPPWGTLNAVDLGTGRILWKVPLGEHPELVEKGIRNTGTLNMGGAVATAGNLVFIGATMDEKFRAFDKRTGDILWEFKLPAGGYATPSIYQIDGKQYIVIAAGGGAKPGTPLGKSVIAFALPSQI
ncbi:PQQ-binding-like beta-propeller repeat protein [Halalkalibaculum sp. DA384]|uniref:outer membrane protein assembly factor BamB family protein n=1 Tax=Halalkalibaculum sp. DA384 TaxID=3373606 RepID=UPI0037547142